MSYNAKNYTEQGGAVTHIGGKLVFDGDNDGGLLPNMSTADVSSDTVAKVRTTLNSLITKLKDAGLMVGDTFTLTVTKDVTDSDNADRAYNTSKIASVEVSDGVITITLSEKVEDLKDFDGGNGWGVHKWLGIGVSAGVSPITDLEYNGSNLTDDDAAEATAVGLSAGYFVRWVAADLVLAGNNSEKSVDNFTLKASGYAETNYKLVIVEPNA